MIPTTRSCHPSTDYHRVLSPMAPCTSTTRMTCPAQRRTHHLRGHQRRRRRHCCPKHDPLGSAVPASCRPLRPPTTAVSPHPSTASSAPSASRPPTTFEPHLRLATRLAPCERAPIFSTTPPSTPSTSADTVSPVPFMKSTWTHLLLKAVSPRSTARHRRHDQLTLAASAAMPSAMAVAVSLVSVLARWCFPWAFVQVANVVASECRDTTITF